MLAFPDATLSMYTCSLRTNSNVALLGIFLQVLFIITENFASTVSHFAKEILLAVVLWTAAYFLPKTASIWVKLTS